MAGAYYADARGFMETESAALSAHDHLGRVLGAVSALQLAMFRTDSAGAYTFANARWSSLAGLPAAAALGNGWWAAVHPFDRLALLGAWQAYLESGEPQALSYRFLHAAGSIVWVTATHTALRGAGEAPTGHIGIVLDVSHTKEQAQLVDSQRAQLVAAARLAALGEMAGGIAHEINTPLSTIGLNVAILKDQLGSRMHRPERATDALAAIERTLGRIASVVGGLRAYARDGAHDEPAPAHLGVIIDDTVAICRQRFRGHGIQFTSDIQAPEAVLVCVPVQITQVLLNLLNNAYQAVLPLRERWVRIEAVVVGPSCLIRVSDSSRGLATDLQALLAVDAFALARRAKDGGHANDQANDQANDHPGGHDRDPSSDKVTGLGLAVSKAIAEAHGGSLRVDATALRTCFVLTLPLAPVN